MLYSLCIPVAVLRIFYIPQHTDINLKVNTVYKYTKINEILKQLILLNGPLILQIKYENKSNIVLMKVIIA